MEQQALLAGRRGSDYTGFYRQAEYVMAALADEILLHHLEWIGKRIPRGDARWLGELLARLSPEQIRDAFRAAGYSPEEIEGFSKIVEGRIAQLREL